MAGTPERSDLPATFISGYDRNETIAARLRRADPREARRRRGQSRTDLPKGAVSDAACPDPADPERRWPRAGRD